MVFIGFKRKLILPSLISFKRMVIISLDTPKVGATGLLESVKKITRKMEKKKRVLMRNCLTAVKDSF